MNRRQFIAATAAAGGMAATGEKLFDGGLAKVSEPGRVKRTIPVLPVGTGGEERFAKKCTACQLCVAACPFGVLKTSEEPRRMLRPEKEFTEGFCRTGCDKCAKVCPAGAIRKMAKADRLKVNAAIPTWYRERCLAANDGTHCTACSRHCPTKAITLWKSHTGEMWPNVDPDKCIGCGACEHYCPARPESAMVLEGLKIHKETK